MSAEKIYQISSLMEKLNQEATLKARGLVSSKYSTPSDMDDISDHIAQLQRDLTLAESQLNIAVNGKLDALKKAADIMDESSLKLTNFQSSLQKIDERIKQTNTIISSFEYLKRVYNAKLNTQKVRNQIEFFAKIPDKVQEMKRLLDADPMNVKEVYLEAIKLESLRDSMKNEIKVNRDRRDSALSPMLKPQQEKQSSPQNVHDIRTFTDNHFQYIPDLVHQLEERINNNLLRLYDLGIESPSLLVMTFEIIEMNREYTNRRTSQLNKNNPSFNQNSIASSHLQTVVIEFKGGLRLKVEETVQGVIAQKIEGIYESIKLSEEFEKNPIQCILSVSNQILSIMTEYSNEIVHCIPPKYNIMNIFLTELEEKLLSEILPQTTAIAKLNVVTMLELIDWIEYYVEQMKSYEFDGYSNGKELSSVVELRRLLENLMNEYLYRIKSQVMDWFGNIKKLKLEIIQTKEGYLTTTLPEDMFNVIYMQLAVAKEKLPRYHLREVVNACLQVLREVQRQSYDELEKNYESMDIESLCSIVNDNQRLQEKCDELIDDIKSMIQASAHGGEAYEELLKCLLQEVSNEYIGIAVRTIDFLVKSTLLDLSEHVFAKLFTPAWESGEQVVGVAVATLDDYVNDLSQWLPEYFFCKYVAQLFNACIDNYVMTLRRISNASFQFSNIVAVTARIEADIDLFHNFFLSYDSILNKSPSPNPQIDTLLHEHGKETNGLNIGLLSMSCLNKIVSSNNISKCENDVKYLMERYNFDGYRIVHCAFMSNGSISKTDRQVIAEKLQKMFQQGVDQGTYQNTPLDAYKGFDSADGGFVGGANANKTKSSRFWGRSK